MALLRQTALIIFASCAALAAHASELPPLVETALSRGETANAVRWAFTQQVRNDDLEVTMRFQPEGRSGTWQLLSPESTSFNRDQAEVYAELTDTAGDPDPDSDLTYEQVRTAIGDQPLSLIEETGTFVTYSFAPRPWDDIEPDEAPILEHLRAEITVDKAAGIISHIRLYAPEAFPHMMVARVTRFEQEMQFEPEAQTGLPLMVAFSQDVRASALFQRIHRAREERYSDFTPMSRQGAALRCSPDTCPGEFLISE